jgi:alpha-mannosidase
VKPAVHLICTAHLDPVWQWRWEEGASEALATFGAAVGILNDHPGLVFCHNEAVLYQWVEQLEPALFREIKRLVRAGRWAVSGGWYLQPDVNLPGIESLIRQIAEGRIYFREKLGVVPRVAYNFDSFGHGGGLPQVLRQAGYKMYIHMRPEEAELKLPSDLYRWRGVDGSEILAYRIAVGLYHTEYENIEERLGQGVELALKLNRDVPVFWGIGDHGGGATREDLERIDAFARRERRVRIIHSTPDRFYEALRPAGKAAPVVEGDLQRVFTGCYTSLSRLKRKAVSSLGNLVETEALRAATWWRFGQEYPATELREAWKSHLFNDFHDILAGSCAEPAEADALDSYGRVDDEARRLKLDAAAVFDSGQPADFYIPVTVLNANPAVTRAPVEVEAMISHRPKWSGEWRLRLYTLDDREILCQEEQPEALLPFNGWRRKVSFMADLPGIGAAHYELRLIEGRRPAPDTAGSRDSGECGEENLLSPSDMKRTGLLSSLRIGGRELLAGLAPIPLVVKDEGDSWGTDCRSYRETEGTFKRQGAPIVVEEGPVRTITESVWLFKKSRIVAQAIIYPDWPVIEFRMRLLWNEERRRLKLAIPTVFRAEGILCEIPGGAIVRPADGEEHVHGRWCMAEGEVGGMPLALGIVHPGFHGLDFKDGEIRLSVLRSAAYCHERGFKIASRPVRKFMDLGVHDFRILLTAGAPDDVKRRLSGLADWLAAPPAVFAHLPIGIRGQSPRRKIAGTQTGVSSGLAASEKAEIASIRPGNIRLAALKRSEDGKALLIRLQETAGIPTRARLEVAPRANSRSKTRRFSVLLRSFEMKTLRFDRSSRVRPAPLLD